MSPLQQLWHLANFLAPACGVALIVAALAKLVWRRELGGARWGTLAAAAAVAGVGASVTALVLTGRDGSTAGYAALVGAQAVAIWLVGFRPWR